MMTRAANERLAACRFGLRGLFSGRLIVGRAAFLRLEKMPKSFLRLLLRGMLPPPDEFKDRNYYDFYPEGFVNYSQFNKLIDEPSSPVGKAIEVQSDASDHYKLPFGLGYYDEGNKKTLSYKTYAKPLKKGYAWYSGGKVKIPEKGFVFVTRGWNVSQHTSSIGSLTGNEYEIFVSAKFTGPLYWPDEKGESHITIDRILLVEPN